MWDPKSPSQWHLPTTQRTASLKGTPGACVCVGLQGFGQDEPESPFSSGGVILAVLSGGCGHSEDSC